MFPLQSLMFIVFQLNLNQRENLIWRAVEFYLVNYNIIIFLTNVDNSNIIIILHKFFHALILFLPNGDVELVYKKVVYFNFDQC